MSQASIATSPQVQVPAIPVAQLAPWAAFVFLTAAIVVFFVSAMKMLISGGTTLRRACGRTTWLIVWVKVRPIARAASACPTPTLFTPDRTASQTKAAV